MQHSFESKFLLTTIKLVSSKRKDQRKFLTCKSWLHANILELEFLLWIASLKGALVAWISFSQRMGALSVYLHSVNVFKDICKHRCNADHYMHCGRIENYHQVCSEMALNSKIFFLDIHGGGMFKRSYFLLKNRVLDHC